MALLKIGSKGLAVQSLQRALVSALGAKIVIDGDFGQATHDAVVKYQLKAGLVADGKAGNKTLAKLGLAQETPSNIGKFLSEKDLQSAAELLGVPLAAVKAVNEVESAGQGFLSNGKCKILFERHKFKAELLKIMSRAEVAALEAAKPNLISSKAGGYQGGTAEWMRFTSASQINLEAAIKSASWGLYQIMGFNYQLAGFSDVQAFSLAMGASEGAHLNAFCHFILSQKPLHDALKKQNWQSFALLYNGKNYKINNYDAKLKSSFEKYSRGAK